MSLLGKTSAGTSCQKEDYLLNQKLIRTCSTPYEFLVELRSSLCCEGIGEEREIRG